MFKTPHFHWRGHRFNPRSEKRSCMSLCMLKLIIIMIIKNIICMGWGWEVTTLENPGMLLTGLSSMINHIDSMYPWFGGVRMPVILPLRSFSQKHNAIFNYEKNITQIQIGGHALGYVATAQDCQGHGDNPRLRPCRRPGESEEPWKASAVRFPGKDHETAKEPSWENWRRPQRVECG